MPTLRDASYIVGNPIRHDAARMVWPPESMKSGDALSTRRVIDRFARAGAALHALERSTKQAWKNIDRAAVVAGLRARVADPALISQQKTKFCGTAAVAFELARRDPARYVETVAAIYTDGAFTTKTGRRITAERELRDGAMPVPETSSPAIDAADWLLTATLRDDENGVFDIDGEDARSNIAGFTLRAEMAAWTRDILGLKPTIVSCVTSGEVDAIRRADATLRAGGTALLLIDANLIKDGTGNHEEDISYQRINHAGGQPGWKQPSLHSRDDGVYDHWVVCLGDLQIASGANDDSKSPMSVRLWSWGAEFVVSGTAEAFSEYLYTVVLGTP